MNAIHEWGNAQEGMWKMGIYDTKNLNDTTKQQSIEAFESAIRKSESALAKMKDKNANTVLLEKRLKALYVGMAVLDEKWNQKTHTYTGLELEMARGILAGILSSIKDVHKTIKKESPQSTLIQRRIKAIEIARQYMLQLALKPLDESPIDDGPFYHGTKADLKIGDFVEVMYESNYGQKKKAKYVYFTATLDAAIWGAELAEGDGEGRIYIVEPQGRFQNDPNLTDKKFPGNPTRSYRSKEPLKVVGEKCDWTGHSPEVLKQMRDHLNELKKLGIEAIDEE